MKNALKNLKSCLGASILLLTACGEGIDPELEAATKDREANLSFHMVNDASKNRAILEIAVEKGITPPGTVLRPYPEFETFLIIDERTRIDQDCLGSAKEGLHPESNSPIVNFRFNKECAKLFGRLTSENIGKRFAVVIDEKIVTAPTIRSAISGGSGFIEGGFDSVQEARELAYILNRHAYQIRQSEKQNQKQDE